MNDDQYAWYNHTPYEQSYMLIMFGNDDTDEQVDMTRAEYIYLKACLAERRGIKHNLDLDEETEAA